ncbi:hypothetical protein ANANG_G00232310 [Anguilla anguilla]|uniref:Uncharacterized protein n=1 Tax=Anguilla anguilla TaxID=7936 RepID=A0A9D3RR91_ANGAN|nr:hypothetical protein ANANG_G00232310 [Anguilla anguilla]
MEGRKEGRRDGGRERCAREEGEKGRRGEEGDCKDREVDLQTPLRVMVMAFDSDLFRYHQLSVTFIHTFTDLHTPMPSFAQMHILTFVLRKNTHLHRNTQTCMHTHTHTHTLSVCYAKTHAYRNT